MEDIKEENETLRMQIAKVKLYDFTNPYDIFLRFKQF
jgi:hypothetical protein